MKAKPHSHMTPAGDKGAAHVCHQCGRSPTSGPQGKPHGRERERAIARAEAAALSPNTLRTYATGWNSFCSWAGAQGVDVLTAGPAHVQGWLVDLAEEGKKPSTLRTYRAAVAHRYGELLGGANPARALPVSRVLSGLAREAAAAGYAPKQADPLRSHHIDLIADTAFEPRRNQPGGRLETPEQAARRALVDIALVSVAHDGLLRCSELLAIRWRDIIPADSGEGTLIYIRRSKTDQTAKGAYAPISPFASQALQQIKPPHADPDALVFTISPSTANRRLKAAAKAAGINADNISTHSPRVGMAQDLVASGADTAAIMVAGRWNTPAMVAHYTRHLAAADTTIAKRLQNHQHRSRTPSRLTPHPPPPGHSPDTY